MGRTMMDVLIPNAVFDAKDSEIRKLLASVETNWTIPLDDPVFGSALCCYLLFECPELLAALGIGPLSKEDFAYNHFWRHLMLSRLWMLLHGYSVGFADREMDLIGAIDHCKDKDWDIVQEMCAAGDAIFDKSRGQEEWLARYYPENAR